MIRLFTVNMPAGVDKPLLKTLHSGYITQGPKVEEFEGRLKRLFKTEHLLTVNSGTSALTLALRLAGVGRGDEVITTPMTCSATNLAILAVGGTPVWADVEPTTGLIDPKEALKHITPITKAIMCVDWGGAAPNLVALRKIADDFGVQLIEDSAHAFGANHTLQGLAHFTCFSLQAIKHITTGDGGVLLCGSKAAYERGKLLRWFGIKREVGRQDSRINEQITEWGYKFHMNDLAATIGLEQLNYFRNILGRHKAIASMYLEQLSPYYIPPPKNNAYWFYTLLLPNRRERDAFQIYMSKNGIQVSQVHRRNDEYKVFQPFSGVTLGKFYQSLYPGLDSFSSRMVCIPVHNNLSNVEVKKIIHHCNEFAAEYYAG